ncbi:MAG: hypothetical protein CBD39_00915 [Flavobacteriaceae bacterium TMED179]|nr:MAG: hypothetical protein CBD39_00915 [Flavobacteriaceae bacterium TMED179]
MKSFQNFIIITFLLCSCKMENNETNKEEWILLFNGKDLSGWDIKIAYNNINENFKNTFQVKDSMIRIVYNQYQNFDDKYGHMYYKTPYSYYKLKFDYRFVGDQTPGGENWNIRNSGVMFHSQSAKSNAFEQHFPVSLEIQLLGGLGVNERTTANLCTPGTAVYFKDKLDFTHCISSESKTYHGDHWVHVEAIILGNESIVHIVENDTVLKYTRPEIDKNFLSKEYQGNDWDNFGVTNKEIWLDKAGKSIGEGYIALQAESHPVDFKNIELLNLCGCMDKEAKNYKSYFIKNNNKCIY